MMLYGLDVGGTKIELAIFDNSMNLVTSWRVATPKQDYQKFLDSIANMVKEADQKTAEQGSVGIGLPGVVDKLGCAVSSNIPCINGQPLATDLPRQLKRPVGFQNDVRAFVLSEANGGAAEEAKYALGVVLGTGVAGALCIDGQLYAGKRSVSEYGHMLLPAVLQERYNLPLRRCGCGGLSCVEQYLSGPGLLWMCSHLGGTYADVPELIQSVQANEAKALAIFAAYIDCLGCYLAQLTLAFDPEVIVLGGGLSNISELYQQLPPAISNYLFKGIDPPAVVAPKFGDSSGIRGAALAGQRVTRG